MVATPIGNLEDVSARALRILGEVDLILAEDTRHSARLLRHYAISTPSASLHDHNERARLEGVLGRLRRGGSLALISDAGTPLLSDPGYRVVSAVHDEGMKLVSVPGPSALTAALSIAGLPADRFVFEGFLPSRRQARRERLSELDGEARTMVFFEAPHRVAGLLCDLEEAFGGERLGACARELTKAFESVHRGPLATLRQHLSAEGGRARGEFVILVAGAPRAPSALDPQAERVLEVLLESLPLRQAVDLGARITGAKRNLLYRLAVARGAD